MSSTSDPTQRAVAGRSGRFRTGDRSTRLVGLYAVLAAAFALLVAPLLALSYFATEDGAAELERATVSTWAEPARDVVGGLLTWASPDRVYGTYWLLFWGLFPAVFLCARAMHRRRGPGATRLERWGWRLALAGYALASVGPVVASAIVITGSSGSGAIDAAFFALLLPAVAMDVIGSTLLGVALVRRGYAPRITAWLLVLALPSMLVLPIVLGNLGLGLLPILVAWAATGWRLYRNGDWIAEDAWDPAAGPY